MHARSVAWICRFVLLGLRTSSSRFDSCNLADCDWNVTDFVIKGKEILNLWDSVVLPLGSRAAVTTSHVVTCINARAGLPIEACKILNSSSVNRVRGTSDTELDLSCLLAGLHIAVSLSAASDWCLKISCSWVNTPPLAGSCWLHGSVGDVSFQSRSLFQPQSHMLADVLLKKSQLISKLQSTSTASSGHKTASSAVDPPLSFSVSEQKVHNGSSYTIYRDDPWSLRVFPV